jgi:prepilin-type N-terminal cleavage/methylation domain-containing protein
MRRLRKQHGFTIVELMIAISIFALVLILITTGVLRFTRQYYKGVIAGNTQDVARAIVDDITRSIQFNGGDVVPLSGGNGYCIGSSKRIRYYTNAQVTTGTLGAHQSRHAFVTDTFNCNASSPATSVQNTDPLPGINARELLGEHMRLAKFSIIGSGDVWTVNVRVVYGADNLLCSPSVPGNCSSTNNTFPGVTNNLTCRSGIGTEFCAVSELTTTINKRVKTQ